MSNALSRRLDFIQEKGAMRSSDIANVLSVRPETVSRWNQGKAFPHPQTERHLMELSFIIEQLADFYEPLEARQWILSRQKLMGGEVPAEMIQANRVADVLAAINQLRDGTYL